MDKDFDIEMLRGAAAQGRIKWHQSFELERFLERESLRAEVVGSPTNGEVIEIYLTDRPYPSCLMLDVETEPVHVVAAADPAARICHVITAYRSDIERFEPDFRTRRKQS